MTLLAAAVPYGASATAAAAADVPTGAITYRHTLGVGAREPLVLHVSMKGPPPADRVEFVDSAGKVTALVRALPGSECGRRIPRLRSGTGDVGWCLRIRDVSAGNELHGTIVGPESALELTITTRHGWTVPVGVAVASLAVGVGLALFVSTWLPRFLTRRRTKRALATDAVTGLEEWHDRARERLDPADLLARLRWLGESGPERIASERERLRALIDADGPIPSTSPLMLDAAAEVARTDVVAAELLTEGGILATSPAQRLAGLLTRAQGSVAEFEDAYAMLLTDVLPPFEEEAKRAHQRTIGHLAKLSATTLGHIEHEMDATLDRVRALADADRPGPDAAISQRVVVSARARGRDDDVLGSERIDAGAVVARLVLTLPVVLVAVAVAAIAVAGVFWGTYIPNHTFARRDDYVRLTLAAIGSSGVAGVLAVVALLRAPARWRG